MINTSKTRSLVALSIVIAAMSPISVFAKGIPPEEQARLKQASSAPLEFAIPASQGASLMDRAQVIITQWSTSATVLSAMDIRTATDALIRTSYPDTRGEVGFEITNEHTADHDEIVVNAFSYKFPGLIIGLNTNKTDAEKALSCAHLLSYELQQFAATLPVNQPPAMSAASNDTQPALPDDLEPYMKLIRTQLAAGDYSTALTTVDSLKAAILNKQKQAVPQ